MKSKKTGDTGERIAVEYLENLGYDIILQNYHSRFGEIDIICHDLGTGCLVFTEVKTRKNSDFARASEYVDQNKTRKIIKTAEQYLSQTGTTNMQIRFDVLEVYYEGGTEIVHIKNAFDSI